MMEQSVAGRLPLPVGSFELDRSPYGAQDLAGLVVEWTATSVEGEVNRVIQRGGGRRASGNGCRAGVRRTQGAAHNSAMIGFRVVREL